MTQQDNSDDKSLMLAFVSKEIEQMFTAFIHCMPEMSEYLILNQTNDSST